MSVAGLKAQNLFDGHAFVHAGQHEEPFVVGDFLVPAKDPVFPLFQGSIDCVGVGHFSSLVRILY
jgi:hypothetical protein